MIDTVFKHFLDLSQQDIFLKVENNEQHYTILENPRPRVARARKHLPSRGVCSKFRARACVFRLPHIRHRQKLGTTRGLG